MENNVNFDILAQKFFAARGEETYCDLFGAVFALSEWHFIADGEFPNLSPYCAVFPDFFDGQPMVLAFTDKERLNKYVAEKNLQIGSADKPVVLNTPAAIIKFSSENLILSIPTTSVIDYLERLTEKGIKGIFFNPNKDSEGFHLGLPQLRETKELVDSKKPKIEAAKIDEKAGESAAKTDFDALARKSNESGGAMDDLNNLFGTTFALEKWLFIARGELPNVNPYIAANADYAGGQQMIRSFTDSNRLQRFAKENNLTAADGSAQMLEVPVGGIVEYLEQFVQYGVHGIWFNSDTVSDGFFIPLKQLRPIKEHLAKIGWKSIEEATNSNVPHEFGKVPPVNPTKSGELNAPLETAVLIMRDGLMSPSEIFTPSAESCICFCRVPKDWAGEVQLKEAAMEKVFYKVYGGKWKVKPTDGSHYIVPNPSSKIYGREEAKTIDWDKLKKAAIVGDRFFFFIADANGDLQTATEAEFRAEIDPAIKQLNELFAGYIRWTRHGKIKADASFNPFFKAVKPLLEDYAGAGEFAFTFAGGNDEPGMQDLFEDVTSNSHGAYLKYRSYIFRRFPNGQTNDMQILGSNRLTNVQTGEKLRVQMTIYKTPEKQEASLITCFLGRVSEVERIGKAIQPALDECGFQHKFETKNPLSLDDLLDIGS